ncbi:MAG: hypothetical protein ABSD67_22865 [Terracidiphilus sp.]|jgi:glycerophosphoryl diester phosphodiesterase
MTKTRFYSHAFRIFLLLIFVAIAIHFRNLVKGNLLALFDLCLYGQTNALIPPPVEAKLVAHAGGAVQGITYTNSREALDLHYAKGYRVFELDFHWTTDNRLVIVHDWNLASSQFGTKPHVSSYDEFVKGRRRDGLHQLSFDDLHEWLRNHPDALVVTDTKDSNLRLLEYLRQNSGDILPHLIIQIYRLSELSAARQLGPRAVWLTVYKSRYPAWALSRIANVDAFVIPVAEYAKYNQPGLLAKAHFYVHSVPADKIEETFSRLPGIYGMYVD